MSSELHALPAGQTSAEVIRMRLSRRRLLVLGGAAVGGLSLSLAAACSAPAPAPAGTQAPASTAPQGQPGVAGAPAPMVKKGGKLRLAHRADFTTFLPYNL